MTNPKYDRDERHKIEFFKRNTGRVVWMGVRHDDKEIHGHRYWIIGRLDRTQGGTMFVWVRKDQYDEWKRVGLDQIVRASVSEPDDKDFMREWDQGLSQRPAIDALLSEAGRHQLDGDAGTR